MKYLRIALTDSQMASLERRRRAVEDAFPGQRVTVTDLVRRWLSGPDEATQASPSALTPTVRSAPAPLTTAPRVSLQERLEAIARHELVPAAAPISFAPADPVESVYDRMLAKRDAFGPAFDPEKLPADEHAAYLEVFTPSGVKK